MKSAQNHPKSANAEEQLAASEERYRQIFEGIPVSVWEEDFSAVSRELNELRQKYREGLKDFLHGNPDEVRRLMAMVEIIDTNEASLTLFEAPNKADLLKGLSVVFTEETLSVFTDELLAIANGEESFENEFPLQTLKGKTVYCLVKIKLPKNGDYSRVLVSRFDITDRKRAEESLKESEAFNRTILESSPDCIKILDLEGRLQYINLNGTGHLELDDFVQMAGKCWWELWDEANQETVKQAIQKARNGEKVQFQGAAMTGKGNLKWWDVVVSPVLEENNSQRPKRLIAVSRDITQHKRAEGALKQSENSFRSLANAVPQIVWIAEPNGAVTYYNDRVAQFEGAYRQSDGNWAWQGMVHPDDLEATSRTWNEAVFSRVVYEKEHRIRMKSGGYRWFLSRAIPQYDEKNQIAKWYGTATDIHDQKTFSEKLEETVTHRTAELKRSNEDLQQFAHVASHDLKEPVRKIRTFSGRLHTEFEGLLPERAKLYLSKIEASAERIYAMINGVLLYSSLDADEQVFEEVDLAKIIREISTDLEVLMGEKDAVLHQKRLPVVKGSPVLLYQLFYNLVGNSLKFARPSVGPEITIEAENTADPGYWKITVQDNGIGFSQEEAGQIFQTFSRLHPKDKYEGTGLGLALCKKIAERHSGSIEAEGMEGRGSKFTVTLPA